MNVVTDASHWIGFDLGGTKMQAAVYDSRFTLAASRKRKTRGQDGDEAGVERIVSTINRLLAEAKLTPEQIGGIGVGVPGPLDLDAGVILESPNLGWKNVRLRDALERQFGCRATVINDVDAGVYGEYVYGAAKNARCALGVFPGTGIGGGMVYEGRIFRGKTSSCLEIGHMVIDPNGAPCGCGRRGCLETIASRLAISAEAAKAAYRGQAPHLLKLAGTDLANIRSGAIAASIQEGDRVVDRIVRDGAKALGRAIASAVNLLAPDVIVLGGGLVEAMPKLYVEEVEETLDRHVMPSYMKTFSVVAAKLGDQAGAMGAAAWARRMAQEKGADAATVAESE